MDNDNLIRWTGIAGLAGALLLMVGDQCLYFAAVSGPEFTHGLQSIVANAPTSRVLFGAALAPFAALLYLAGFWHVHAQLRTHQPRLAAVVAIGLALCILAGTCYHALWGVKALAIQATHGTATVPALAALQIHIHDFAANVFLIAEAVGYPAAILLALLVVGGRSNYPRWFVLLTPAIPLLCLQAIGPSAPAPFGSLLNGSASNLSFALFFAGSLALTWKRKVSLTPRIAS